MVRAEVGHVRRNRNSGFSLVELAMTVTILTGATLGVAASVLASVRLNTTVTNKRQAARAVQSLTEEIRATPFEDLATTWSDVERDAHVGGETTTARFEVLEIGTSPDAPVFQIRVRLADPLDAASDMMTRTIFVSSDAAVESTGGGGAEQ